MAISDLLSSDPVSAFRSKINDILDIVNIAARDLSGTLASRPAANSVEEGTYYFATDTADVFRSDGAAWTLIHFEPDRWEVEGGFSTALSGSVAYLPFATETLDSNDLHSTSVNPERVTIERPGIYSMSIVGSALSAGSATSFSWFFYRYDSSDAFIEEFAFLRSDDFGKNTLSGITQMNAGDYIKFGVSVAGGSGAQAANLKWRGVRVSP